MQDFINEINGEIPKISKRTVFKILVGLKLRYKKYSKIGLGKRDGEKFNISERQMTYFIDLLIQTGHLLIDGETRTKKGFLCRVFKLSDYLKEELFKLKDKVFTKVDNLSERVKKWESENNTIDYIKNNFGFYKEKIGKKWFKYNGVIYVIPTKGEYENKIFDTTQNKIFTLFNFIKEIKRLDVVKTALLLNIIG